MSAKVEQFISELILREGDYSDHPSDRGGPTRWGITQAVARLNGYDGDMRVFPELIARDIYREQYWEAPKFHLVSQLSLPIAEELFDTGVNMGQPIASKFLQRCLNVLNRGTRLYPDVTVDGVLGTKSLTALASYLTIRGAEGETVLLRALNCLQGERYIRISENDMTQEDNVFGWLRTRVVI